MSKYDPIDIADLASSVLEDHSETFFELAADVMQKAEDTVPHTTMDDADYDRITDKITEAVFAGVRNAMQIAITEMEKQP